ncbi:MAG: proline-specific peptidase [Frankiales bacterium]|jgi:proline iminopeptidase|nr:proline-specific peptidase [Frankiales bacterium]
MSSDQVQAGGIRTVPVTTPSGTFRVWTKQTGESARVKLLLLHGGPGATHEYLLGFDSFLPQAGVQYHYYDQLGSGWSDAPDDPSLWQVDRFVDEVEQVRQALGLGPDDFVLYGQSWGGILAIEYALAHPEALKGLVLSNMMSSIPAYNRYADEVLVPAQDPARIAAIKAHEAAGTTDDPEYDDLLMAEHYPKHVLRLPVEEWPEPVVRSFSRINKQVYVPMQGPSELGASGTLSDWDRSGDLGRIDVPTLVIGAEHDTMDPAHLREMAARLPRGTYLHCPDGSHLAMYDDQQTYMSGLLGWLADL